MPSEAMPPETKFDVMADLCILAGQAVMQVGSNDLQAAMRVVLGILGREVAVRSVSRPPELKTRRRAGANRPASCA